MGWSWANIDWNGTGAMVQAIGSVLAIGAAIVIDQGTARRERNARRDELAFNVQACSRLVTMFREQLDGLLDALNEPNSEPDLGEPTVRDFEVAAGSIRGFPLASISHSQAIVLYTEAMRLADLVTFELRQNEARVREAYIGADAHLRTQVIERLEPLAALIRGRDDALRRIAKG